MAQVSFLLNGDPVHLNDISPTKTLLDWLREDRGLSGTKEGCNEGDCGACTVMVTDENGSRAVNACILFLPQLHGKALRTVEGILGPGDQLHPVQTAMIEHHGSQCGFCTPGFVVSMAVAHKSGATDFDTEFAGNLCRCTGYAPIIRAAEAAADIPSPDWMTENLSALIETLGETQVAEMPKTSDELAKWYEANPDGTLVGGATDIGLWVTKKLVELKNVAFLSRIQDLKTIEVSDSAITIGACASETIPPSTVTEKHPQTAEIS